MKNEAIQETLVGAEDGTPLMVFREILRLAFEDLFVVTADKEERIPREAMALLNLTFDMDISDMISARSIDSVWLMVFENGVVHRALQNLTTAAIFQLSALGPRDRPYELVEVARNFCLMFQPGMKEVQDLSFLNEDNRMSVSYYRDQESMSKMLVANPWMLVIWILRFDRAFFDSYSTID